MKKILFATITLLAVIAMMGGGTLAYFFDDVNSNANSFTAGTLTMQISNNGTDWSYPTVTGSWNSPTGWEPGEEFTSQVHIRNTGSIDAKYLGIDWKKPTGNGMDVVVEGKDMSDFIIVTELKEYVGGVWNDSFGPEQMYPFLVGNKDGVLTLKELSQSYYGTEPNYAGPNPKLDDWGGWVKSITDAVTGGGYDITPADTPAIAAGGEYILKMTYKLDTTTPNEYQGKGVQMNIAFKGMQDLSQVP